MPPGNMLASSNPMDEKRHNFACVVGWLAVRNKNESRPRGAVLCLWLETKRLGMGASTNVSGVGDTTG